MASLRRFPKSPFWFACFLGPNGQRRQASTKQTDRDEAMRVALTYERASRLARRGEATEAQLRKILSETLEAVSDGQESLRSIPTEDYLRQWLSSKVVHQSPGTSSRYASTVRKFLEHLGERAGRPLTALRPADFQSFQTSRLSSGVTPSTVNVDLKTLATAMNRARKQGLIPANPVEAIEKPGRVRQRTHDVFTQAEIEMLLAAERGTEWETAILLGTYTGQRLGDCTRLRWDQIDLSAGTLTLAQEKTGRGLTIPLNPRLLEHLESRAGVDRAENFVCPGLAMREVSGRSGLSIEFVEIMRKAGVDSRTERAKGGRAFSRRSFHSLRHTFNTFLAEHGIPQEIRMLLTGHRSARVNDRYTKLGVEKLREAVNKL